MSEEQKPAEEQKPVDQADGAGDAQPQDPPPSTDEQPEK